MSAPLHTVMIAGGGTGGHLYPGIALAQEIVRRQPQARVVFVGTARGIEVRAVPRAGFALELLPVSGLRNVGPRATVRGLTRLPLAVARAWALVRRLRPQVAVSVGGYAAGPAVLAARAAGVPCALLEQNAVAGATNRLLAPLCRRLIAAMPCDSFAPHKTRVLGNPVRADLLPLRARRYAPRTPPRLLVLGGSQGARALNDAMVAAAPLLAAAGSPWQVLHQAGQADAERVGRAFAEAGLRGARAVPFIDAMDVALGDADLMLCRAGATTLAEVTVCGLPSILVPYPFAAGDHQSANARLLEAAGAALVVPQPQLTAASLVALLTALHGDPARLQQLAARSHALGRPDAVAEIYDCLAGEVADV